MQERARAHLLWSQRLSAQALIRSDELSRRTEELRREVLFLTSLPAVSEVVRGFAPAPGDGAARGPLDPWMQRLEGIYAHYFQLDPYTMRLSLIDATQGRELLAVARSAQGTRQVAPGELRSLADQPHFRSQPAEGAGDAEVSVLRTGAMPVLGVSAAVRRPEGTLFGYILMQVDTRALLADMFSDLPAADRMFISDASGDFLVLYDGHAMTDAAADERVRWRDFARDAPDPRHAAAGGGEQLQRFVSGDGEPLQVIVTRVALDPRDPVHAFTLGIAVPERTILRQVKQVSYSIAVAAALGLMLLGGFAIWYRRQQDRDHIRQARLAAIITSSADAVISERLDGVVADWNPGAERMFGYRSAEAIGRPLQQLIVPPGYEQEEAEILAAVPRGEVVPPRETIRRRADGSLLHVSLTVSPIRTPKGAIIGEAKTIRDITLRKHTEETLKKSRAQLSIFVEHSLSSIAMFDNNMRYLAYSNAWLNQFGRGRATLRGMDHYAAHPNLPQAWIQAHRRGLAGLSSGSSEERWVDSNGREHWGRWMVMPWLDESGGIGGIIISGEDLSELKQGEAERERLLGELRELNAALEARVRARTDELSSALREREILLQEMHHRVKNNLQVISSLIRMQMRQIPRGIGHDALEDCQARIQAIALIHEKLYQTKNYASIAISEYVSEMAHSVFRASSHLADTVQLELELERVSLPVDRAIPCGLILNELISNALKHAFPGSRRGSVQVLVQRVGESGVRLGVRDDGVGLRPGIDALSGHTLGLQLVQTLTRQIDGRLEISGEGGMRVEIEFTV